jgi:hypothetical protein
VILVLPAPDNPLIRLLSRRGPRRAQPTSKGTEP